MRKKEKEMKFEVAEKLFEVGSHVCGVRSFIHKTQEEKVRSPSKDEQRTQFASRRNHHAAKIATTTKTKTPE